jgi:O-antigen ligase
MKKTPVAPKSRLKSNSENEKPVWFLILTVAGASLAAFPVIFDSFITPKMLVLSAGLLCFYIVIFRNKEHAFNSLGRLEVALVLLTILGLTIATFSSGIPFARSFIGQFGRGNGLGYYSLVILIMVSTYLIYSESSAQVIDRVLRIFSWVIGVYAILQSWGIDIAEVDTTKSRILLTLGNSNFSGGILAVFFCYNLIHIVKRKSKKFVDWSLIFILMYATLLTGAVQGLLIVSASIIIAGNMAVKLYFTKIFKKVIKLQIVIYLIVVVLGFLKIGPINMILNRPTLKIRFEYWNIGLQMIRDNPLLGVGPDAFYDHSAIYMAPGSIENITYTRLDAAHNWFINIAANFGLLTLIPLLVLFIVISVKNINIWFFLRNSSRNHLAVSITFTMLLVDAMVSVEQPGLGIWMYFFAGMNLAINSNILDNSEAKKRYRPTLKIVFISAAMCLSLLSTSIFLDRIFYDLKMRSDIRAIVTGQSDRATFVNLTKNAIRLRSEPEYANKAIEQLAKIGDANGIDRVSASTLEYNFDSLQSLLIRQEVLQVLNRPSEACPIVESLIQREPWELILWKRHVSCNSNITVKNRNLAEVTWPFLDIALSKADIGRPDYLTLLTLAAYNNVFLGKTSEAERYYLQATATSEKFNLQTSDEFRNWMAEPFNVDVQLLISRLEILLKD